MSTCNVRYHDVDSYQSLLDIMKSIPSNDEKAQKANVDKVFKYDFTNKKNEMLKVAEKGNYQKE